MALFLAVYCGLTGFSAACLRASVMLLLGLLCQLWGRRSDPLTTIGASMLAVLLIDPLQGLSAGFVLSFSAVAGILLLAPGLRIGLNRLFPKGRRRVSKPRNLREWRERWLDKRYGKLRTMACVSLAAQLGVLLPSALYFHAVPLYGVGINLLVIPLVELLLPVYGLTLLLSPLPRIGLWAGWVASLGGRFLLWLTERLSWLPYASLRVASPTVLLTAAGMLALFALSRACRGEWKRKALAATLVAAVAGGSAYALRPPDVRYVQLAVGQADAALLFDRDQTVAIDVGADGSATLDYLMDTGRDLDALVLTHLHLDHAGGVQALLDAGIRVKRAYLPVNGDRQRLEADALAVLDTLDKAGVPVERLERGDTLAFRDTELRVLWPDGRKVRSGQDANDLPLVLDVRMNGYSILNMSDLTGDYEQYVVQACDVLKAAHHGSDRSTGDGFLDAARPAYAIVSCSSGSRSLPGAAMLERLTTHGIPAFRTDQSGDVTLWVDKGELRLAPYKGGKDPVNHIAFFDQVKKGAISPVYLFEGPEEYIKQQALASLYKKLLPEGLEEMNRTELTDPEADALIAAAETLPFMGEKRVVVVRECSLLATSRKAEDDDKATRYAEYVERVSPTTCLVFYVKGKADGRKKLYTLLKKKNAIVDFSPMSDGDCADWAQKTMARMEKNLDRQTAAKLVFTVGRDAATLRQEMDKLAGYLGERRDVTDEDVDAVCTRSTECTVFQMVDAQVAGKDEEAFGLLADMVRSGEDRMGVLAMLLRQYRILYHMRCLLDEGAPQGRQAALLGIPPFAVGRTQQQARRFDRERLKLAYDSLLDYEYQIKTGRAPQEGCAENALLRLEQILRG